MTSTPPPFSAELQAKIDCLKALKRPINLGKVGFSSNLLLAPMSGICHSAFRLFMQDLGTGGSVSEFVSCHGINYENKKSNEMLYVDPREKNVGIQLFGEDGLSLAKAAEKAQEKGAEFIDLNMGCPVRKVVTKGGGSALLKDPAILPSLFKEIKKAITVPFTIKIRTGWDDNDLNADKIIQIAHDAGIEMVSIHGRTRSQQYTGKADWDYIESIKKNSPLPLIGNGDLHSPEQVRKKLKETHCEAVMIARGCLRSPFIFLESLDEKNEIHFSAQDHFEALKRYQHYVEERFAEGRPRAIQIKKAAVWFAAGLPFAAKFRTKLFQTDDLNDVMKQCEDYYMGPANQIKSINFSEVFMQGGHG